MKTVKIMSIVGLSLTGLIWLCNLVWLAEEDYEFSAAWLFYLGLFWIAQSIVTLVVLKKDK